jgi:D-alanyl-D-alanine carboxypeptidase
LSNAGLPREPAKLSTSASDDISNDIPEALRDTPEDKRRFPWKPVSIIVGVLGIGSLALSLVLLIPARETEPIAQSSPEPTSNPRPSSSPTPTTSETRESESEPATDDLLGHLPYPEASPSELEPITPDGRIQLRKAAAKSFKAMSAAAQAEGISLAPLSGYRSVAQQQHLFFDIKAQRGQVATKRAEVSAPPGYSEHHTGYAIDIGDGHTPATNLSQNFENTAAFQWLEQNAAYFSFELSFPRNNPQGVSYEPWHWRYVGDRHSLETFYKAKELTPPQPKPLFEATPSPSPTETSDTLDAPTLPPAN